ncbi:Eri1p NDAI_0C05720 [Naumovozyma dairenensis CBS 421]|uniref:Uncharacterized protein n=1 Tax=Naumovozyma dairenensis (strain ATCC 10597 / BCRC 20456 / CBS 421 / NBRC 0211 / NRRL Y-12639) TaxID=1071378 RepID=G0W8X0_NAUDC|nr:hypothetical protein NDAI_0C05720 [Naumovozyma dairenensis CBS 421]CCD24231.1 hypothetical protein NDAI_0C05720 [Naumovozyma dairenensis CBS 421]
MNDKSAGLIILLATWTITIGSGISFLYLRNDPSKMYYLCWILISPTMFWVWTFIAWFNAEMFRNAKVLPIDNTDKD